MRGSEGIVEQKIEALSAEDAARIEKQRNWVRDHYDPESVHLYDTLEGKLRLLDTILKENWIEPNETWKLQSLGITFGDALAQKMELFWVAVEDEHGRDPRTSRQRHDYRDVPFNHDLKKSGTWRDR